MLLATCAVYVLSTATALAYTIYANGLLGGGGTWSVLAYSAQNSAYIGTQGLGRGRVYNIYCSQYSCSGAINVVTAPCNGCSAVAYYAYALYYNKCTNIADTDYGSCIED